jgi:hypothetical protein
MLDVPLMAHRLVIRENHLGYDVCGLFPMAQLNFGVTL